MGDRYAGRSPPRRGPPPRDRPPARDRDDHPNVEYFGAGESYRPGGQTGDGPYRPVRERENDRWNPDRREERKDDRRREEIDSYIPPTSVRAQRRPSRSPPPYRRRSRSPPPNRGRTELFPDRPPRSPPPRRFSPPRDRSPIRRRSRSPYTARGRSPDNKRPRDFSPGPRRSPKRERLDSPPRGRYDDRARSPPKRPLSPERISYRPNSRSPPRRDDRRPNYAGESWRRRSPSPRGSAATSRRSSPPVHPDRISAAGSRIHSPMRDRPRYDDRRDDTYIGRPRSPGPRNDYPDRERDRSRDATSRDLDDYQSTSAAPPTGPRNASYSKPPPSGPARSHTAQASSPPTGPASISAHNRSNTNHFAAPPSGPRGAGGPPPRDFTSPTSGLRGRTSLTYRAPGYRPPLNSQSSFESPPAPTPTPPAGPRASSYSARGDFTSARGAYPSGPSRAPSGPAAGAGRGDGYHQNTDFPYRPTMSNNSSSTTYPRSQRFNTTGGPPTGPSSVTTTFNNGPTTSNTATPITPATPASFVKQQLNTLERVIPGGRKMPGSSGMTPDQEKRMKQLEDDAERVRLDIAEKQKVKREALREWEVRERESEIAGLKSSLAEDHLRALGEEDGGMVGAAF